MIRWASIAVCCVVGCAGSRPTRAPAAGEHASARPSASASAPAADAGAPARRPGTVVGGLARGTGTEADRELYAGDQAIDAEDYATARQHYGRAAEMAPDDPAPQVGLVRVRLAETGVPTSYASAPDDARLVALGADLDRILEHHPGYGPAELERGRIALILGRSDQARVALTQAATLLPEDAEAHSALGVALLATGQRDRALAELRRASELDPDNPERLGNLGTALITLGRIGEAIQAYRRAVTLAPDDARLSGDLGTAYLASGQPEAALPYLERAVALAPERATFLSNLGYAQQLLGRLDQAIATYRKALEIDARLTEAWINLATAYAKQKKLDAAEEALRRAQALAPDDPRVQENLRELEGLRRGER